MQNKILLGLAALIAVIALQSKLSKKVDPDFKATVIKTAATPLKAKSQVVTVSAPISEPAAPQAQEPGESEVDHRLNQISTLVQVVIPTPAKIAALRPLLADPALATEIRSALNDPKTFGGAGFTRKLRLLDAMYEGLKFPDQKIRQKYFELSADILNQTSPDRKYLADRVEIALVLTKNFPEEAHRIRAGANEDGKTAFREAKQIASLYEAAL